jgi:hypothetical protein
MEPIYNPDGSVWVPDQNFADGCKKLRLKLRKQREQEQKIEAMDAAIGAVLSVFGCAVFLAMFLFLCKYDPEFIRCFFGWQCGGN